MFFTKLLRNKIPAAMLALSVALVPLSALAAKSVQSVVGEFHAEVLDVMKKGTALGQSGRVNALKPVANKTFDIPTMARQSVGTPRWNSWTAAQQKTYSETFRDFLIATYAGRFRGYAGESFEPIQSSVQNGQTWVTSAIIKGSGDRVSLRYLLLQTSDGWRIADVYLEGSISELSNWKSQFAKPLRDGGYDGVIKALKDQIARLEQTPAKSAAKSRR